MPQNFPHVQNVVVLHAEGDVRSEKEGNCEIFLTKSLGLLITHRLIKSRIIESDISCTTTPKYCKQTTGYIDHSFFM